MGDYGFERFERVGGHPALDFVNTVQRWDGGRPGTEYLVDYTALAKWHAVTGLLDARTLRRLGPGSPATQRQAWQRARRLRDALYRLFAALAADRPVPQKDLDELQRAVAQTASFRRLQAAGPEIAARWDLKGAPPVAILGPVAWSAAELLERGPRDRIKACPSGDGGCGWLFLDLSKNRSRNWCSMKTCGNVAKVRRFRARH